MLTPEGLSEALNQFGVLVRVKSGAFGADRKMMWLVVVLVNEDDVHGGYQQWRAASGAILKIKYIVGGMMSRHLITCRAS